MLCYITLFNNTWLPNFVYGSYAVDHEVAFLHLSSFFFFLQFLLKGIKVASRCRFGLPLS